MSKFSLIYNDLKNLSIADYFEIRKYRNKSIFWSRFKQKIKMGDRTRMRIVKQVVLSREQKEEIRHFYKSCLGKNVSTKWHRYYQGISNAYDKTYLPEIIYTEMELLFNDRSMSKAFSNKVVQHTYFKNFDEVYVPKVYAQVHNGNWYTIDMKPLSIDKVACIFNEAGSVFAKPISDSSSGSGCELIKIKNGVEIKSGETIESYISKFKNNYMFEEVIVCCDDVSKLHPASVNTFRVMSYRLDDDIHICPIVMRIGRNNSEVDNAHAGGLSVGVSDDGVVLSKYANTEFNERFDAHPDTNVVFENYRIQHVDKIVKVVKEMHRCIPGVGIASWDMTLNDKNMPTFIEVNLISQGSWLPQIIHGRGMFGDNTEKMLKKLREKR